MPHNIIEVEKFNVLIRPVVTVIFKPGALATGQRA